LRNRGQHLREWAPSASFLVLAAALAYFVIDPRLIYHAHGEYLSYRIHVPGMTDSEELLGAPGGVLVYVAARLALAYHSSYAGTLLIAAVAWLLAAVTGVFPILQSVRRLRFLRFLPGVLVLVQYGRYFPYLADALALLLGLLLALLYMRLPACGTRVRLLAFSLLALLSYTAGSPGFAVFVALCAIHHGSVGGGGRMALLLLATALPIPWLVGAWGYGLAPFQAYGQVLPAHPAATGGHILTAGLFLCVPTIAACAALYLRRLEAKSARGISPLTPRTVTDSNGQTGLRWSLGLLALVGACAGVVLATADTGARVLLRANYLARHRMWSAFLETSRRIPPSRYSIYVNCDVNRALYHTGRLSSDLFSYPQHGSQSLLLTDGDDVPPVELVRRSLRQAEVRYELGLINQSEQFAHEALEQAGYCPVAMQRLAMVNLIKGRSKAAGVFLQTLRADPVHGEWAQMRLRLSADERQLAADPEVRRQRILMLKNDTVDAATPLTLFVENEQNQMAYEYLMAFSLLEGQHAPVAHGLGHLDTFDYPKGHIPRHYKEAALLYAHMSGTMADLHGRRIRPETVRRFQDFLARSRALGPDPSVVLGALDDDFGNTYYYYYLWLHSQEPTRTSG
jgi:uncharacterized protein DUF6057